jgi:hypothetical protein
LGGGYFKLASMCFGTAKPYYSILNECCPNYLALFKKGVIDIYLDSDPFVDYSDEDEEDADDDNPETYTLYVRIK